MNSWRPRGPVARTHSREIPGGARKPPWRRACNGRRNGTGATDGFRRDRETQRAAGAVRAGRPRHHRLRGGGDDRSAALVAVRRRDQARRTILALAVTFFLCYMVFLFFPVAGPRYAFDLPSNAAAHVWPARAAQWVLDMGDSWGAAFPSSHVAGAVVATGMAVRYWRPLGLALLPVTAGLVLGVVYGQFHYGVDALSGLVVAGLSLAVMEWWRGRGATSAAVPSVAGVLEVS